MDLGRKTNSLIDLCVSLFQDCHCENGPIPGHPEPDKTDKLAIAILEVFWYGCLPQMKENRKAYPAGYIAIGYSTWEEERRRLQTNQR
jgi:hypothetical protein